MEEDNDGRETIASPWSIGSPAFISRIHPFMRLSALKSPVSDRALY